MSSSDMAGSPNPESTSTDLGDGTDGQRYAGDGDETDLPMDPTTRADDDQESIVEGYRQHPRVIIAAGLAFGSILLALLLGLIPFAPALTDPILWAPLGVILYSAAMIHIGTKSERGRRKRDGWAMLLLEDLGYPLRGRVERDGMGGFLIYPVKGWRKLGYKKNVLTVEDVDPAIANIQGKQLDPDDEAAIAIDGGQGQLVQSEDFGTVLIATGGTFEIAETHPSAALTVTIPEKADQHLLSRFDMQITSMRNSITELVSQRQTARRQRDEAQDELKKRREQIRDEFKGDITDILEGINVATQQNDRPRRYGDRANGGGEQ